MNSNFAILIDKHAVFLVLLDVSAAFRTIDHNILLSRLQSTGVKGSALEWITSYLSFGSQAVSIENDMSSLVELPFVVPQGSVLGLLFFTIYASPVTLVNNNQHHDLAVHTYADDTQLYLSFSGSQLAKIKKEYSSHAPAIKLKEDSSWSKNILLYFLKIWFFKYVNFGAISWKNDILSITA